MKKSRFLALTLVVAIMLMGAGYAYWSDSLQINTTVSTGEFDVKFQNAIAVDGDKDDYLTASAEIKTLDIGAGVDEDKDLLEISLGNLYPGAVKEYSFEIVNSGSIPVKFETIVFEQLGEFLDIEGLVTLNLRDSSGTELLAIDLDMLDIMNSGSITLGNPFVDQPHGGQPNENCFSALNDYQLDAGDVIDGTIEIWMKKSIDNDDELENESITYTLTYNFKQHNKAVTP